jgi:Tol biopolymer transport system component
MTTTAIHPTREAAASRSHWTRRRLALAVVVPTLAAAGAGTSLVLEGSAGPSSAPVAAAAPAPAWTPLASPWVDAVDVRDLKRQLVAAGYQVKVDDSLDPVTKSAFADFLRPGSRSSFGPGLVSALRGTVLLGRQNPAAWNVRFGLNRPTKFVERPLTGRGGQLDGNGNIRPAVVVPSTRAQANAGPSRNGAIAFVDRARTLNLIKPNGKGLRRLAPCHSVDFEDCEIRSYAWSPNGKYIAFLRGRLSGAGPPQSNLSLFVTDARGKHTRRLARCGGSCHVLWGGAHVSWAPDGTRIVFSADDGVHVVNRVTGETSLPISDGMGWAPSWSPDGTRIAFVDSNSLYTIRPDGSGLFKVATVSGEPSFSLGQPEWSPNAQKMVFDGSRGIYSVGADGSDLRLLRSQTSGQGPGAPAWSPDGSKILFFETPQAAKGFIAEAWVMSADGSHARRVYRLPCCVAFWHQPIWSPDGKSIAVSADACSRDCTFAARAGGIVVMDRNGRHRRRLSRSESEIAWQPIPRAPAR